MAILVDYGSSDGEDDLKQRGKDEGSKVGNGEVTIEHLEVQPGASHVSAADEGGDALMSDIPTTNATPAATHDIEPKGPVAGPLLEMLSDGFGSAPQSPYSTNRALIRDLTLPTVPNLDIQDSPPGSPDAAMEEKFAHFLRLKKQGFHFNERLARSTMLKNPSILGKLMENAGLSQREQYATTLPREIWNPDMFPDWAFKDELAKAQLEAQREREESQAKKQRDHVDFVSSTSGPSSRSTTPASGLSKGLKGSAAERVMAGLDRDRGKLTAPG